MMNKVLVSPVAFNENIKLRKVIERFLKSPVYGKVDYLIVDDASTDGTTEMIRTFTLEGVQTIKHEKQSGVGAAIRTAIKYARNSGYDVLVIMAGNNKDNPNEIPGLIDPIFEEGFDFVQGSRYKGHTGTGGDMPLYRKITTRIYPVLMSLITGKRVTDASNGFRAFRLSLFDNEKIDIDQSWLDHYELEPYLLYKAITLGYKYSEASVTKVYPPRELGYTKMKPFTGWWSILRPVVYLGLRIKK